MSIDSGTNEIATRRGRGKALSGQGFDLRAKQMIRNELVRRGVSHQELVERLTRMGARDSVANLRNKLSRGRFTAGFLLQVMVALGAKTIDLEETLVDLAQQN